MNSLYWHDYETWGDVPSQDRPSQFAGVRTDEELNVIGSPLMLYCKPSWDVLPKPEACLVTGITPQKALEEGVSEREFIRAVHGELSLPGTCGVGYNSIRFDDEVTRYTLYRNFYDPYEREWRNGNSRWDIIDMLRMTYALRPAGIIWPTRDDGLPSFKLEHLCEANGLSHESAHDALSDVYATIDLARLVKNQHPELYQYQYQNRLKKNIAPLLDTRHRKPLLHVSSRFSAEHGCMAVVAPVAKHPVNSNAVIVVDLSADPSVLADLSAEAIEEKLYTRTADLAEGESRIPLKLVHLNKSPALATIKLLSSEVAERLSIDRQRCEKNWQTLLNLDIEDKLTEVFAGSSFDSSQGPAEEQLYGGFIGQADKYSSEQLRNSEPESLNAAQFVFEDRRLSEMFERYKARNFPELLNPNEAENWVNWCRDRLADDTLGGFTLNEFSDRLNRLYSGDLCASKKHILDQLKLYADHLSKDILRM